jgi:hypothetical protein
MVARELFIVFTATCCFLVSIVSFIFACMNINLLMIILLPKIYSQYDAPDTGVIAGLTPGTFLFPLFVTLFFLFFLLKLASVLLLFILLVLLVLHSVLRISFV